MKQYEVEVMGRYSHGRYGKERYFGLVLSAENCEAAKSFAEDIVYGMTYQEFFDRCMNDAYKKEGIQKSFMNRWIWIEDGGKERTIFERKELDDKISQYQEFTFKARVFKG